MCDTAYLRTHWLHWSPVSLSHERKTRNEEMKGRQFVKYRTNQVACFSTLTLLASYVDAAAKGEPCAFYRSMYFTTQLSNVVSQVSAIRALLTSLVPDQIWTEIHPHLHVSHPSWFLSMSEYDTRSRESASLPQASYRLCNRNHMA